MHESDLAALAEDRSRFFWWLAEWFLSPPSRDRLALLYADNEYPAPEDTVGQAWLALTRAAPDPVSLDDLGAEFTRLTRGIQEGMGPPPPFESVWREGRLIGESTEAVIDAYARAGFADIDPDAGPQDHIAVELKFLSLLALREAEARRADADPEKRLAQQREFLEDHLIHWAPRWADAIIAQAHAPLYAALADLLKAVIDQVVTELADGTRADAANKGGSIEITQS